MTYKRILLLFIPVASLFFACHPERNYVDDPEASLTFTLDTLFFDTVFTTLGTTTEAFKVKNPHNQFISIDEIEGFVRVEVWFGAMCNGNVGELFKLGDCLWRRRRSRRCLQLQVNAKKRRKNNKTKTALVA